MELLRVILIHLLILFVLGERLYIDSLLIKVDLTLNLVRLPSVLPLRWQLNLLCITCDNVSYTDNHFADLSTSKFPFITEICLRLIV